ncbi:MAG: hypothetical protein DMF63_04990 [Acidobacteria bacterium]|nr:MAG: hypothetical protein DMF63_04990 [Acidobacteriota bacterium]
MIFANLETLGRAELVLLIALGIPFIVAVGLAVFLFAFRRAKLKKCPCGEWGKPEAVVCRFCGRDLK